MPTLQQVANTAPSNNYEGKVKLLAMLRSLLSQKYKDTIDRFIKVTPDSKSGVTGIFQSGAKYVNFRIETSADGDLDFSYSLATARNDAWLEAYVSEDFRLDKKFRRSLLKRKAKKKVGNPGLRCGNSYIEATDVCHLGQGEKPPTEFVKEFRDAVGAVAGAGTESTAPAPGVAPTPEPPKDDLEERTIRDLKQKAAAAGVYRYGVMTASQLRDAIRTAQSDPEHQERLRKTIVRKQLNARKVERLIPQPFRSIFKKLKKIGALKDVNGTEAAVIAATLILAGTAASYNDSKAAYKQSIPEAATQAYQRAQGIPVQFTSRPDIIFTVAGSGQNGADSVKMADALKSQDSWFKNKALVVPFTHTDLTNIPPQWAKGRENSPTYVGYEAVNNFGKYLSNLAKGNNEAATDLAAKIYAYGTKNPKANINLVGGGLGGTVNRAALEILSKVTPSAGKRGLSGNEILSRVRMANLGSPNFGFTDSKFLDRIPQRNIFSTGDPFSLFPKKMPQWIGGVKGHSPIEYLKNKDVLESIKQSFGAYSNSLLGREASQKRWKENSKAVGSVLRDVNPVAGKIWDKLSFIAETARENPIAAGVTAAGAIGVAGAYTNAQIQKNYAVNIKDSSAEVMEAIPSTKAAIADTFNPSNNVMMVVGGNGVSSAEFADKLDKAKGLSANDRKFMRSSNLTVPIDRVVTGQIPEGLDPKSPAYAIATLQSAYEKTVGSMIRVGKNPEAVNLAANIVAHAEKHNNRGQLSVKRLPINIMAYGDGGLIAREALDILNQSKRGKAVIPQVHLTTLGTPHFGINKGIPSETNVIGDQDIWAGTPFIVGGAKTAIATGVAGGDLDSYLASPDAMAKAVGKMKATAAARTVDVPLSESVGKVEALEREISSNEVLKTVLDDPLAPEPPQTRVENYAKLPDEEKIRLLRGWKTALYSYNENKRSIKDPIKFEKYLKNNAAFMAAAKLPGAPQPLQTYVKNYGSIPAEAKLRMLKKWETAVWRNKEIEESPKATSFAPKIPRTMKEAEAEYLNGSGTAPQNRSDWTQLSFAQKQVAAEEYRTAITNFAALQKELKKQQPSQAEVKKLYMTPLMLEVESHYKDNVLLKGKDPRQNPDFGDMPIELQIKKLADYHNEVRSLYTKYSNHRRAKGEAEKWLKESKAASKAAESAATPNDQGRTDAYMAGYNSISRLDAALKCGPGNKRCGKICIPVAKKCNAEGGQAVKGVSLAAAVGAGLAGAAVLSNKEGASPAQSDEHTAFLRSDPPPKFPTKLAALAGVAGVSTAAAAKVTNDYRKGFKVSAEMAQEDSKKVDVPEIPADKKAITFTIGGFYGYEGDSVARKGEDYLHYKLGSEILGDKENPGGEHFMVQHRNHDLNTSMSPVSGAAGHIRDTYLHYKTMLTPILKDGRNPEAVKLASEAIAFHRKYPDKQINLVGHRAGGMISHEAAEILHNAKVPVNVVNLGTGYFGMTPKRDNQKTIAVKKDMYLHTIPGGVKNAVWVGESGLPTTESHRVRSYMNSPDVRAALKENLAVKSRTDSALHLDRAAVKCGPGTKRCGKQCIPQDHDCHVDEPHPVSKVASFAVKAALLALPAVAIAHHLNKDDVQYATQKAKLQSKAEEIFKKVAPKQYEVQKKKAISVLGRQIVEEIGLQATRKATEISSGAALKAAMRGANNASDGMAHVTSWAIGHSVVSGFKEFKSANGQKVGLQLSQNQRVALDLATDASLIILQAAGRRRTDGAGRSSAYFQGYKEAV